MFGGYSASGHDGCQGDAHGVLVNNGRQDGLAACHVLDPNARFPHAVFKGLAPHRQNHAGQRQNHRHRFVAGDQNGFLKICLAQSAPLAQGAGGHAADHAVRIGQGLGAHRLGRQIPPVQVRGGNHIALLEGTAWHRHRHGHDYAARKSQPLGVGRLAGDDHSTETPLRFIIGQILDRDMGIRRDRNDQSRSAAAEDHVRLSGHAARDKGLPHGLLQSFHRQGLPESFHDGPFLAAGGLPGHIIGPGDLVQPYRIKDEAPAGGGGGGGYHLFGMGAGIVEQIAKE